LIIISASHNKNPDDLCCLKKDFYCLRGHNVTSGGGQCGSEKRLVLSGNRHVVPETRLLGPATYMCVRAPLIV
jgi:hypothetical protein